MSVVVDYFSNIGLDVVKDKIKNASIQKQAHDRLVDYLSGQKELNLSVTKDEEIDFKALVDYIESDLMDDVIARLLGKGKERGLARQRIIDKSKEFAQANTKMSVERTVKIVSTAMDILANYYKSKVNRELLFIASEIEETIISEHQETRDHVTNEVNALVKKIDALGEEINTYGILSIDKSIIQIKEGRIKDVEDTLATVLKSIGTQHDLFPYYQFGLTHNFKLFSQPLSQEAIQRYPQNIRIQASSIRMGQQKISHLDEHVLNHAYRHQQNLYIDVETAEQFLGTVRDPAQNIAEEMMGKEIIVKPPQFPSAFPCYVTADDDVIIPYLLLRTKEIMDDGTFVITNEEQRNFPYLIKIVLDSINERVDFTTTTISDNNVDRLNYCKFVRRAQNGALLAVTLCDKKQVLVSGRIENNEYKNLDKEISFLESIIKIEKYFDTKFTIPEEISITEYEIIRHLCSLIDGEFNGCWTRFECRFIVSDELKENINNLDNKESCMAHTSINSFVLFGQEIKVPTIFSFKPAIIENYEKTVAKIGMCDNGDEIKVTFIPSNKSGTFKEVIYKGNID